MSSVTTSAAKEKGNAAFKAGDYPTAIGHYTTAILADRNEPTFPLNRAAAYLKLGKYDDAARDCSTVLGLDPSSVKALFRRAQAKMGLDRLSEAQDDYKAALKLEPANESIQAEIKMLGERLERLKPRIRSDAIVGPSHMSPSSVGVSPRRRRIPIDIVEPVSPSSSKNKLGAEEPKANPISSNTDLLKPVSSRPLSSSQSFTKAPASASSIPTSARPAFKDAKEARESARPSRAGGGIFRQSGNHSIFGARDLGSAALSSASRKAKPEAFQPATNGSSSIKPPMTLFNFSRTWETSSSTMERWSLISIIPPSSLPSMFQMSLEPSLLVSLLETFRVMLDESPGDADIERQIGGYMKALPNIPRFNTVWLFLGEMEKEYVKVIWRRLGVENPGNEWV